MSGFEGLHVALAGPLPPPAGGMAVQTAQLADLLRQEGAEVTLVQTNAAYRPLWVAGWPGVRAVARLLPYLVALWRAAGRADVMHVMANSGWSWHLFAAPAIWVGALRGVPVVVNYRGGEAPQFLARSARLVRLTMRCASKLVVPSGFLQQVFADHAMAADIVPNVVDLARFKPRSGGQPAVPHLVVTRNLEALYDNATAVRAFAEVRRRYPQARLTIAGTGPELEALGRLARELGVHDAVAFPGRLDRDAMAQLLREASVVVNPSLADNMPNSVLEAMASGVPVVSTNVGGVPHIVSDGASALLVPPRSPQAMVAAILRLLDDVPLAERIAATAFGEVRQYTWARVAPRLALAYRNAAAAAGKAAATIR